MPNLVEILGSSVEVDDVEGVTLLGINPPVLTRSSRAMKRGLDIVIAAAVLLVTLPLMLVAALAIKLTSRGPVFFSQERIGRGERRFRLYKFRTMVEDAEEREAELRSQSSHPAWLLLERDPRVTRVGRCPAPDQHRRAAAAGQRAEGRHEPGRPAADAAGGRRADRRLGAAPARSDSGDNRALAGARPHQASPSRR